MRAFVGLSHDSIAYNQQYEIQMRPLDVEVVENCYLVPGSTCNKGDLADLCGGVFDSNGFFVESSSQERFDGECAVRSSQPQIPAKAGILDHREAVFGGVLLCHFGHFLLEGSCRLWHRELVESDMPWVFITAPNSPPKSYMYDVLSKLGLDRSRIHICHSVERVGRLYIPAAAIKYHSLVNRCFLRPFAEAVSAEKFPSGRYYLSRAHLEIAATIGESELIDELCDSGVHIMRPEELSINQQIALFRSGNQIIGIQGSALHMGLFAPGIAKVAHLMRSNTARSYFMLDDLASIDVTYVDGLAHHQLPPHGASGPFLIDVGKTLKLLDDLGVIERKKTIPMFKDQHQRLERRFEAWWYHQEFLERTYRKDMKSAVNMPIEELLIKAIDLEPGTPKFRESYYSHLVARADASVRIEHIIDCMFAHPERSAFPFLASLIEQRDGRPGLALVFARRAVVLKKNDTYLVNHLALLCHQAGNNIEAIDIINHEDFVDQRNAISFYILSLCKQAINPEASEYAYALRAYSLEPSNKQIQSHLFISLYKSRLPALAKSIFADDIKYLEKSEVVHHVLGLFYAAEQNLKSSLEHTTQASLLSPENVEILRQLDRIRMRVEAEK